jgi:hypothetical protein
MLGAPLGFILSLIGLFADGDKRPAAGGLAIAGLLAGLFFFVAFCA